MNSSKHLLLGLLILVLGLLAISTYQFLGKPTPRVASEQAAGGDQQSEEVPVVDQVSEAPPESEVDKANPVAAGSAAEELTVEVVDVPDTATEERLYAAVSELENRLRGYIDDAVERASEQSQTPTADELGEQVAAKVMASIRGQQTDPADVERLNRLTASDPTAAINPGPGPTELQQVHFLHDSSELTPGAQRKIKEAAEWFRNNNPSKIRVVGFSDTRGTADYNLVLSQRRADSVASLLVRAGIPEDRLEIEGMGEFSLPEPTGDGIAEPLNRCVGIMAIR